MPAYIGYYVTHDWTTGNMSWSAHLDSAKGDITSGNPPKQEISVKYQSTNTANGDVWALVVSLLISLIGLAVFLYVLYTYYIEDPTFFASTIEWAGVAAGGFVATAIIFFILNWIMLLILMPGNKVQEIPDASEAIAKVSAGKMTVFGLISVFLYKMCGKKRVTK